MWPGAIAGNAKGPSPLWGTGPYSRLSAEAASDAAHRVDGADVAHLLVLDDRAGVRGVQHHAAAGVQPDVRAAVEEDQVADLQVGGGGDRGAVGDLVVGGPADAHPGLLVGPLR